MLLVYVWMCASGGWWLPFRITLNHSSTLFIAAVSVSQIQSFPVWCLPACSRDLPISACWGWNYMWPPCPPSLGVGWVSRDPNSSNQVCTSSSLTIGYLPSLSNGFLAWVLEDGTAVFSLASNQWLSPQVCAHPFYCTCFPKPLGRHGWCSTSDSQSSFEVYKKLLLRISQWLKFWGAQFPALLFW